MAIISGRDEEGNFIGAADAWTEEKIEILLKKYNPNGKLWYSAEAKKDSPDKQEKD